MPKIKARCVKTGIQNGKLMALIECNGKVPKKDEVLTLKWGSTRTVSQNKLYWLYLTWLIEHGGLKEHGHFDPQALHENLKAHFLAEKIMDKGEFKAVETPTTTTMGRTEFGEYFDKIDHFMAEFFHISTADFWADYQERAI